MTEFWNPTGSVPARRAAESRPVRQGFRSIGQILPGLVGAPKTRQTDVGKIIKRDERPGNPQAEGLNNKVG